MTLEALLSVASGMVPAGAGVLKFKNGVKKVFRTARSRHVDGDDPGRDPEGSEARNQEQDSGLDTGMMEGLSEAGIMTRVDLTV